MPITLCLADDHEIVRRGIHHLLKDNPDIQLVGEASTGAEALRLVEELKPDVLVLDLMMPGMNGLEVARRLHGRGHRTAIIILSVHGDAVFAGAAFSAGAAAFVTKNAAATELLKAINSVARGEKYQSSCLSLQDQDPYQKLTSREREVLRLTGQGQSSKEIGRALFISPRTVEGHRASILQKLGLGTFSQLVRYAVQRDLAVGE